MRLYYKENQATNEWKALIARQAACSLAVRSIQLQDEYHLLHVNSGRNDAGKCTEPATKSSFYVVDFTSRLEKRYAQPSFSQYHLAG